MTAALVIQCSPSGQSVYGIDAFGPMLMASYDRVPNAFGLSVDIFQSRRKIEVVCALSWTHNLCHGGRPKRNAARQEQHRTTGLFPHRRSLSWLCRIKQSIGEEAPGAHRMVRKPGNPPRTNLL